MQVDQDTKVGDHRRPLQVEVEIRPLCPISTATIHTEWMSFLDGGHGTSAGQLILHSDYWQIHLDCLPAKLRESCLRAFVSQDEGDGGFTSPMIDLASNKFQVHVYKLSEEEVSTEEIEPDGGDNEWTAGCDSLPLPHASLHGLWEALILEPNVKQRLLDYAQSALLFSSRSVSPHVVHWNRILLLHGVPGTGKTSLCRSLAHKLAIRMGHRFPAGTTLLDVRAHSLFSKWFSTSGKLVSTLFQMVQDMVQEEPNALVCVLVDEVESLASARNTSGSSGDPSDAMRAVNSLLTSLDRLRPFPNVLILATTNLTGSVDMAFVDRVDLKIHIGLPILKARYEILKSCLAELQRVGILVVNEGNDDIPSYDQLQQLLQEQQQQQQQVQKSTLSMGSLLLECARQAEGLSGRSLRRLPLQAHAHNFLGGSGEQVSVNRFLVAILLAIHAEQSSRKEMSVN